MILGRVLGGTTGGRWEAIGRRINNRVRNATESRGISVRADDTSLNAERQRADLERGQRDGASTAGSEERGFVDTSESEDSEDEGLVVDAGVDGRNNDSSIWGR